MEHRSPSGTASGPSADSSAPHWLETGCKQHLGQKCWPGKAESQSRRVLSEGGLADVDSDREPLGSMIPQKLRGLKSGRAVVGSHYQLPIPARQLRLAVAVGRILLYQSPRPHVPSVQKSRSPLASLPVGEAPHHHRQIETPHQLGHVTKQGVRGPRASARIRAAAA